MDVDLFNIAFYMGLKVKREDGSKYLPVIGEVKLTLGFSDTQESKDAID